MIDPKTLAAIKRLAAESDGCVFLSVRTGENGIEQSACAFDFTDEAIFFRLIHLVRLWIAARDFESVMKQSDLLGLMSPAEIAGSKNEAVH